MRKLHYSIALCFFISMGTAKGQTTDAGSLVPYFSAIIVSDMEASKSWYTEVLGFEVESEYQVSEGFSIINLRRELALELIRLPTALSPKEAIPDYSGKTRLHGLFKIGFSVGNLDIWVSHLSLHQVNFHGEVVTDPKGQRMVVVLDPDGNRIQLFEK